MADIRTFIARINASDPASVGVDYDYTGHPKDPYSGAGTLSLPIAGGIVDMSPFGGQRDMISGVCGEGAA